MKIYVLRWMLLEKGKQNHEMRRHWNSEFLLWKQLMEASTENAIQNLKSFLVGRNASHKVIQKHPKSSIPLGDQVGSKTIQVHFMHRRPQTG